MPANPSPRGPNRLLTGMLGLAASTPLVLTAPAPVQAAASVSVAKL